MNVETGYCIDSKNCSSWSMRPWLALRITPIAFDEKVFITLYQDNKAEQRLILSFTHSGKVLTLIDGDVTVWDSLSIIEAVAEKFPQAKLWPEDSAPALLTRVRFGEDAFQTSRPCATEYAA